MAPAGRSWAARDEVPAMGVLLAACAGATDVLAFFGLGKAFAGIVTGNLVTAGYGVATGSAALIKPTVTAVAGSIAGEITWARLLRRPRAGDLLLIAELALFLFALAGWLAAGSHPAGLGVLALLALVSVALGGQSIWALRIHQTTTYFTGMLTKTISTAGSGAKASIGASIRQLGALVAGAIISGAVLNSLRPAAPAVPLLLLAAAAAVHFRIKHRAADRVADQQGARHAMPGTEAAPQQ
jgi:uncharacterized membrane protein YoaK (UPF0700 family)